VKCRLKAELQRGRTSGLHLKPEEPLVLAYMVIPYYRATLTHGWPEEFPGGYHSGEFHFCKDLAKAC